jgi:hypothetical protein
VSGFYFLEFLLNLMFLLQVSDSKLHEMELVSHVYKRRFICSKLWMPQKPRMFSIVNDSSMAEVVVVYSCLMSFL